jgi:hypothetical protein
VAVLKVALLQWAVNNSSKAVGVNLNNLLSSNTMHLNSSNRLRSNHSSNTTSHQWILMTIFRSKSPLCLNRKGREYRGFFIA